MFHFTHQRHIVCIHLPGQTGFPLSPWRVPQCPSDAGNEIVMIRPPSVKCIPYRSGFAGKGIQEVDCRSIHTSAPGQIYSSDTSELFIKSQSLFCYADICRVDLNQNTITPGLFCHFSCCSASCEWVHYQIARV